MNIMKMEKKILLQGIQKFSDPRLLLQAATDPVFPDKQSGSPLPRSPTNFES